MPNPNSARDLPALARQAGLKDVKAETVNEKRETKNPKPEQLLIPEHLAPVMIETPASEEPIAAMMMIDEDELEEEEEAIDDNHFPHREDASPVIHWELQMETDYKMNHEIKGETPVDKKEGKLKDEAIASATQPKPTGSEKNQPLNIFEISSPVSAASGGY